MTQQEKWDQRYRDKLHDDPIPAQVLHDFAHLLPTQGKALDLASGLGGNALFLAARGLSTSAWDIASVAIGNLKKAAVKRGLPLSVEVRDVLVHPPEAQSFDIIVVSRFLDRRLCPAIISALRPGGLLFYQTFTREKGDPHTGPQNPGYLLAPNELLSLFSTLQVIAYREEGTLGDTAMGFRNEAYLVARLPL